jgi:DNA ligase 1
MTAEIIRLKTIYKKTTSGKTQHWTIEIEDNKFRTIAGQVGGKDKVSKWTICEGKNIGKANETSGHEQALKEAESKRRLKLEGEYKTEAELVDESIGYVKPMLAENFTDYWETLTYPVLTQRKYNGMRCVITAKGMYSRNGKKIVAAPHIFNAVQKLFVKYPNLMLDGELYSHDHRHNLNRILSIVRKSKPTAADLEQSEKVIDFHIYDCTGGPLAEDAAYTDRYAFLDMLFGKVGKYEDIFLVDTDVALTKKQLDKCYEKYLSEEYEGQMIRVDAPYQNKRTSYLLKRKEFQDEEFLVLDIEEGKGDRTGTAGRAILKLNDDPTCTKTFDSNIKGEFSYLETILKNKEDYIGKSATVKFFVKSEYGVPQWPYIITFNREAAEGKKK